MKEIRSTMKTKLILAVIALIIMVACNKENTSSTNSASIIGEWNWISSTGGIAGMKYTPETTGEKRKIIFDNDSVFRFYRNDTLKIECKYHILKSSDSGGLNSMILVKYDSSSIRQYFTIQPDGIMVLSDECMDCYLSEYKRIR